jgi:ubiquinone/menaquinone biosynthesis C-methylase UbiE
VRDLNAEENVRQFYDKKGWNTDQAGTTKDAELWEDLRECAADYVRLCRLKLLKHLPKTGDLFLDAASGPIQYPEYLEYSAGFTKRVCVDLSQTALDQAKQKLGDRGEYVCTSILDLPFPKDSFDAVTSLHTIYHINKDQQEAAVRQLIRVTKPGKKVIIIYANPDRLMARLKRLVVKTKAAPETGVIYYYPHPLSWWQRFSDQCNVEVLPWRTLTALDSKLFIPGAAWLGKQVLRSVLALEERFPGLATRFGAYPMVLLTKKA